MQMKQRLWFDVPIYTIEYTDDNDDVISVYFGNNTGDNIYATLEGEKIYLYCFESGH